MLPIHHVFAYVDLDDGCPSNSPNDRDDRPTWTPMSEFMSVNLNTGYPSRSRQWGSPDLELEGMPGDTRFIQVRVARVLYPTSCLE
jgi:hypothetical protein